MEYVRRWVGGQSLEGKAAVLTGAGGGIGGVIALSLAAEGVHLLLSDAHGAALARTQAAAVQRGGGKARVLTHVADLRKPEDVAALAAAAMAAFGHVDFLLNVAGALFSDEFAAQSAEEVTTVLHVNLQAPLLLTRALLPAMLARRSGVVLNTSSIVGFTSVPRFAVYSATKAALNAWAVALRAELRGSGVRVANICPGFVTGAGMYETMLAGMRQDTAAPLRVPRLHGAWEVSVHTVAAMAVKGGAPAALVTTTLAPMRLLGALQSFAPDWATAWLVSPLMPGNPFFIIQDEALAKQCKKKAGAVSAAERSAGRRTHTVMLRLGARVAISHARAAPPRRARCARRLSRLSSAAPLAPVTPVAPR